MHDRTGTARPAEESVRAGEPGTAESVRAEEPGTAEESETAGEWATAARVVIPSALAGFAGGRSEISVELPADGVAGPRSPLTLVLDELRRQVPALERRIRDERGRVRGHVNIYLDGTDIRELGGVETVVVPGATVQIIAAISGG
ncbi:MoaD/ThiS family protein [Actinospica sp. MGRD01-02]|uniref:MoaD/ThiS family protein n=1 Tax=Actinospica acidithermotolerans TaxID=2828514 RepID=A0A941E9U5_9ACTN|nr:MoaD/ThiS family protein [Actinospica acidithermotolerans]MBR7827611.1 MoaD/ThiS family protein [Actinospica acidithermotolerans]